MEKVVINATKRTIIGKKVGELRREGKLPGVLYGHKFESTPIVMDLHIASKILHALTGSSIVTISLDGVEHSAIVREKQKNFIRGTLQHIDFLVISMTEKLKANVGIVLTGIAPAVKELDGLVVNDMSELEVECLPQYLPEQIEVDLSSLVNIGDGIFVKDLTLDSHVEILADPEEQIVHITLQRVEEEPEEEVEGEAEEGEEPEVIEKGKKEEGEEE
jgi:large subunit ribosomal protein L25